MIAVPDYMWSLLRPAMIELSRRNDGDGGALLQLLRQWGQARLSRLRRSVFSILRKMADAFPVARLRHDIEHDATST